MTSEFGAAIQLEKIDMLDFADAVAINKFDRRGAADALWDVRKQMQRNRNAFGHPLEEMPVYGTVASRFHDDGVTALYHDLREKLAAKGLVLRESRLPKPPDKTASSVDQFVPASRERYLAEIAQTVRAYKRHAREQGQLAREHQHLCESARLLTEQGHAALSTLAPLQAEMEKRRSRMNPDCLRLLCGWPELREAYSRAEYAYEVRDRQIRVPLYRASLSGTAIPRVSLPRFHDEGDLLEWLMLENLPGHFPYTAGVFPLKREAEEPTRMFAGEGTPRRTNSRFHYLSKGQPAVRLSTAFDAVTLYGEDPHERPDIFGKIGNSGVSVATLDDMRDLYSGFDLCDPSTSVSMTINGPAPAILAMFLNVAIDQQKQRFLAERGREPAESESREIRARVLSTVRGTVQADILKEDQGQNTCIFSTGFSLRCMADIQEYFIQNRMKNFYSVSVSGYHMAEAGANPIHQLAFTLANGFTLVEAYLGRGMHIDDFAPNFSFFFSNGMDPEYSVLGRVAAHLGRGPAQQVRGQHKVATAEVSHSDQWPQSARAGDGFQRYSHHAAGLDSHLRQLQLTPYERFRRGHHHADRRVGAQGTRYPIDHQPRVGCSQKRKPEPGQLLS
jgi:methylmalonyl-CoA mutase